MSAEVQVEGFYCHAKRSIAFPVGVTLIVGPNGAGKSAIGAEPFAWGFFGKTLRGGTPGDSPAVRIDLPGLGVSRVKGKRSTALDIAINGELVAYETATKAQEALELHLGLDFAGWRRTHVFSAAGVAQFSEATDAERKRLLEGLLGLDRFDAALTRCRDDLKTLKFRRQGRVTALAVLRRVYDECKGNAQACRDEVEVAAAPPVVESVRTVAEIADLVECVADAMASWQSATKVREEVVLRSDRASRALKEAVEVAASGVCKACNRPFDNHDPAELERVVGVCRTEVASVTRQLREAEVRLRDALAEVQQLEIDLREAEVARARVDSALEDHAVTLKLAQVQLAAHEARLRQADADLEVEEIADEADIAEALLLERVEKVLGLKGARALVLGSALDAIEGEANVCLEELAPGVSMDLTSDNGSIGLAVGGFGAGAAYENLSTGERCRVDIALLLAIASVAPQIPGLPIVFDDVFGALDDAGIEAVSRLLARIGRKRPVAVITQLDDLRDWLTPIAAQVVSL